METVPQISPLDLIMFRGGEFFSDLIALMQRYKVQLDDFTHVGLVVTSDILKSYNGFKLHPGKIYVLESTFSYPIPSKLADLLGLGAPVPDVITGGAKFGVQLRDLEELLPAYLINEKTRVAWCKLKNNPYQDPNIVKKFKKVFKKYHGIPYEGSIVSLLSSIFPPLRKLRKLEHRLLDAVWKISGQELVSPSGWQFCSELIANIYKYLGIIDKSVDPMNVVPMDFMAQTKMPQLLEDPVELSVDKLAAILDIRGSGLRSVDPLKKALLVGINYDDLRGCINDVHEIRNLLIRYYGYSRHNILIMTDNNKHLMANAQNIMRGWRWLLTDAPASAFSSKSISKLRPLPDYSRLFFHFSGHGILVPDQAGDEVSGYDSAICPVDYKINGVITDDLIRERLVDRVPASCRLTSIVDACHSGTIFDLRWFTRVRKGTVRIREDRNYTDTKGLVVALSGCLDEEKAVDKPVANQIWHGALTHSLLHILAKHNYRITCNDLLLALVDYMREHRISSQNPCISYGRSPTHMLPWSF